MIHEVLDYFGTNLYSLKNVLYLYIQVYAMR